MSTLNIIAERVASALRQPTNHELKERAKISFKGLMAKRIRESFARNGIDESYILPFTCELIDSPMTEIPSQFKTSDLRIKRTINKIPNPVRIPNGSPFTYIGATDYINTYLVTYVSHNELKYANHSPFPLGSPIYAYYENNYLYIGTLNNYDTIKLKQVTINYIPVEPDVLLSYYDDFDDGQDMELPLMEDVVNEIISTIIQSELGITQPKTTEVPLNIGDNE